MKIGLGADVTSFALNLTTGLLMPAAGAGSGNTSGSYSVAIPGYGSYNFTNGFSNDSNLPPYLQSLTPAQLATDLAGGDPTNSLLNSFAADAAADNSFLAGCGSDPYCGMGAPASGTNWGELILIVGGAILLLAGVMAVKR